MLSRMRENTRQNERIMPAEIVFVVQPNHVLDRLSRQRNHCGPVGHSNKKVIESLNEFIVKAIIRQFGLHEWSHKLPGNGYLYAPFDLRHLLAQYVVELFSFLTLPVECKNSLHEAGRRDGQLNLFSRGGKKILGARVLPEDRANNPIGLEVNERAQRRTSA